MYAVNNSSSTRAQVELNLSSKLSSKSSSDERFRLGGNADQYLRAHRLLYRMRKLYKKGSLTTEQYIRLRNCAIYGDIKMAEQDMMMMDGGIE